MNQGTAVHVLLQFKGGMGKSLIASLLAQYFLSHGYAVHCIDADPLSRTLSYMKRLNPHRLKLLQDGSINSRGFDPLFDMIMEQSGIFIVDSSASTSIQLASYLAECDVPTFFKQGRQGPLHTHRNQRWSKYGKHVTGV